MKRVKNAGAVIVYRGKLCQIIGYATDKVLFIREIGAKPCKECGEIKEYAEVEVSRNFQERSEPVDTLIVDKK